ncbi:MAG: hypothetical protein JXD21_07685 [Candidatus Omnitrophica bacterium]|nr:hypothetical protein [Candidatus Omnitrophota bacterium]
MLKMLNIITPTYGHQANITQSLRGADKLHDVYPRIRVNSPPKVTHTAGRTIKEEFEVKDADVLKGYDPGQYSGYQGINLDSGINLKPAINPVGTNFMPIYGFTGPGSIGGWLNIYA